MSEHRTKLAWNRTTEDFEYKTYSRDHDWEFENGLQLRASATPDFLGNPECVDPEQAFVAALASCHMLTFLAVAAAKRFVVDSYTDEAVGYLEKGPAGKPVMTRVVLHPKVTFSGEKVPGPEDLGRLHEAAHSECFLANSVTTEITVEAAQA